MTELRGFWAAAAAEPDRIAVVAPDGTEWRAGDVLAGANQLVHGLRARGLGPGDRVAAILPNSVELLQVLLAVFQAGWHYIAVNTHLTDSEKDDILSDAAVGAVFGEDALTVAGVAEGQPVTTPDDRVGGQFMQYTSGTTGRPKAVLRELPTFDPETWVRLFAPNLARYDIDPGGDGVHLVTSPMYHMAPLSFGLFSLHFEHKVVLMDGWDAETALRLIEQHRVTSTHMVPTQFHRLVRLPEDVRSRSDVSSLRNVMHAAAPCPVELKQQMLEWFGPVIYEYYGATEGGGTIARPDEWLAHPGTVGRPWEGADVKILDDDRNELGPGQIGTVYMKLMGAFEYKGDPEKTNAGRVDGYFTVGDVGELDEDGFLYLRDRKIDMIISGGVNVYPAEVEAALLAHPAVADAAVFGVPNDDWGEEVKAVVELAQPTSVDELLAHCQSRLAAYKVPRSVDVVDALPRDPSGKLYKRRLRDPYWAGRERAI